MQNHEGRSVLHKCGTAKLEHYITIVAPNDTLQFVQITRSGITYWLSQHASIALSFGLVLSLGCKHQTLTLFDRCGKLSVIASKKIPIVSYKQSRHSSSPTKNRRHLWQVIFTALFCKNLFCKFTLHHCQLTSYSRTHQLQTAADKNVVSLYSTLRTQ